VRILIAFVVALTFIPNAEADRIEVAPFKGSKQVAKRVRKGVMQVLRGRYDLVARDGDGVVKARVRRKGRRYQVQLYVFDRFGDVVEKLRFTVSRRGLSKKQKRLLKKKLARAIALLPVDDAPDAIADDDPGDRSGDRDFIDDDEPEERVSRKKRERPGPALTAASMGPPAQLHAGLAAIQRNFTFGLEQGNYDGGLAGAAQITASAYPLAFDDKAVGWKARLGVGLAYERSIGLKSQFPGDEQTLLGTVQSRFYLAARYRVPLGKEPRSLTVTPSLGFEQLSFNIDRSAAPGDVTIMVPNTSYSSLVPGAELWYAVNDKIAVVGAARLKLVVGAGDVTSGSQYGSGSAYGYDVDGAVEYGVSDQIVIRAGLQAAQVKLSFDGNGELSQMGDFTSASDTYLAGYAGAGFRL
jgi:hypothetical protein